MLSDVLSAARSAIVQDVEPRLAATEPFGLPADERRARLNGLIDELVHALERGTVADRLRLTPIADEPALERNERELLQRYVIEQVERGRFPASVGEVGLVFEWTVAADRDRLRERVERMAALLDRLEGAAVVFSPDGRVRYLNRHAERFLHACLGLSAQDILGKTPQELEPPLEIKLRTAPDELVALARDEAAYEFDLFGRAKEGRFSAVYGPEGSVTAVQWTARDIHDRKVQSARIETLSKLSVLIGSVDYDEVAGALARVPIPELADWCGVTLIEDGELRGTSIAQRDPRKAALRDRLMRVAPVWRHHPLWREMLTGGFQLLSEVSNQLMRRIAVNEEQYQTLTQIGVRSLMVLPLVSRLRLAGIITLAFTDESGRRYGRDHPPLAEELALHAAHIVEDARLMKHLKMTEARFRIALAGARTIVFEQDSALRYTWCYNPVVPIDLVGKTAQDAFPAADTTWPARLKHRVIDGGESVNEQIEVMVRGERRHYREAIEPVRDHTGKVVGVIGAATDVTDEYRAQQELQESVAFRERLMGILGHDLRSPLSAVTMAAALLLRRQDLVADALDHVRRIQRAARRMDEMIGTLLDFTRLRALGKLPISPVAADLGAIVRDAIDELGGAWPGRAIDVEVRGDARGEWDPARISQLTGNLVGNALAYGDPRAAVRVSVAGEDSTLSLKVSNAGPPIPADLIPTLFEPFRRGISEDRSPGGLGLGLYIVQQIVIAHGGDIGVESTAETGTTFTVRLARHAAER
jgi:PAS domain S-box-containing protein